MSLPFTTDTSVQLSYTSFPFTTPKLDNYATSNYLSNVSNILKSDINATNTNLANNYYNKTSIDTSLGNKQDKITTYSFSGGSGGSIGFLAGTLSLVMPTSYTSLSIGSLTTATAFTYKGTELTTTLNAKQNTLTAATTLLGTGGSITGINFNTVINKPSYTSPLTSNSLTNTISIDLSSYTTNTNLTTNYYTKTATDTLLSAKQATLTFSSPLTNTANTISIDLSSYTTNTNLTTNYYTKTATDTLLNAKQATLTFSSPLTNTANTISIDLSSYTTNTNLTTNYYTKTATDTLLNAKQATLTAATTLLGTGGSITGINFNTVINKPSYTSPLTSNSLTNTITFNESSLTTLTNFYNKTDSDGRYLKLIGGALTGDLTTNSQIKIDVSGTLNQSTFKLISGSGTTNRASRIDFLNIVASTTVPRWTIINDFSQNGTNDLRIINAASTNALTILQNGLTTINYNLIIGNNNDYPNLQLGSTNGHNLAVATGPTAFSSSSLAGDLVLRSINNLHLLSGDGAAAITIKKTNNNVGIGTTNSENFKLNVNGTARISSTLSMGETLTAPQINLLNSTGGNNVLYISSSSSTANNCIQFKNNSTYYAYIGVGGSALGGNYQNNLFLESQTGAIILNTNGRISTSTPNFIIKTNGDIETSGNIFAGGTSATNGLRINGSDYGNTIYQNSTSVGANIGFTLRDANKFRFFSFSSGVYTEIMNMNTTAITLNEPTVINSTLSSGALTVVGGANFTGSSAFNVYGPALFDWSITCRLFTTTSQNPHDYVGITSETTSGAQGVYTLYTILNSFTGLHRSFTNDELFDENNPEIFKDNYEGRIVISSGLIATQIGNQNDGYDIKYDKEGIYVEDAHPIIQLSRTKKDKRVFGVLGRKNRNNSNEKRMIINGIGEGALWVCNSNGSIENGDYITTSDYLGYGEKQDEIFLCNYTVAKATMNCNFELDSPLYQCVEIDDVDINNNKIRIAFIAVSYHCS
jgi:hypothetical protein